MSLFSVLFGITKEKNKAITLCNAAAFKAAIANKKVQLIDVRTPDEYKSGHIKGAQNMDYFSRKFKLELDTLAKEKAVYVYCRSGSRSGKAAKNLAALGFKEIYDLKGGFLNYN